MDVLIFGGSGLIGQALAQQLTLSGDRPWVFSRSGRPVPLGNVVSYSINTLRQDIEALPLERDYAIVNLAGESISSGRWTERRKQAIRNSRVFLTQALAEVIGQLESPPSVFVSGSAVGYYGSSTSRTFTESSPSGVGFLPEVTRAWEQAARDAEPYTRVVLLRTGVVLSQKGGALTQMILPYKLFAGGRVGSGEQWVSWIHIADMVGIITYCLNNPGISGVVNATAPSPVVMDEFGKTIGTAMKRPHWFPVPSALMRVLFGEMSEILLEGQRVLPNAIVQGGYEFQFPNVAEALADLLSQHR